MSGAAGRLLRLRKAFEAQAAMLEQRLCRLERQRQSRAGEAIEVRRALALPLVAALPLFAASARRIGQLEDEIARMDRDIAAIRRQLIEAHARSELSAEAARQHAAVEARSREARDLAEIVTVLRGSSLPQDGGD